MRSVDDFVPFVQAMAVDADELQCQQAIREAIIRFMRDTQVFDDRLVIVPQEGVCEYNLDVPQCRVLVGVKRVFVDRCELYDRLWARDEHHDVLRVFTNLDGCCVEVDYTWTIGRDGCAVPDKVYEDYMPGVIEGSLEQLHRMFGTDIVSRSRAIDATNRYQEFIADTKARKVFGFAHSRPRMRKRNQYRR
ncbi:hypothetical protein ACM75Z_30245 [Pseudomonas aeruginosa]